MFSFTIDRFKFVNILESVLKFNPKSVSNKLELLLTDEDIKLFAKKEEEEFESSIPYISRIFRGVVNFAINAKFMLDAVKVIKDKDIKIQGSEVMSPIIVNDNHLVMPIKIISREEEK